MKYYYEYKEKNGCKVGGNNLETIEFYDNYIKLSEQRLNRYFDDLYSKRREYFADIYPFL